jgi:uncharacterized protein (TIGR03000 family)
MRRSIFLSVVSVVGLLGLLLLPQQAQAQRFGGGYYGGGYRYGQGYYGNQYGSSNYYYPTSNYATYDNSMQYANYFNQNQVQGQDVIYDSSGQAWDVSWANPQDNSRMIFMEVRVPSDAQLWIDNQETMMRGTERMFASPPVTTGKAYTYNLKAQWKDPNGQDVTRTQTVTVQPGQITPVDLTRGQVATQPQTNQPQSIEYQANPPQANPPQVNPPQANPPQVTPPQVNPPRAIPPRQP